MRSPTFGLPWISPVACRSCRNTDFCIPTLQKSPFSLDRQQENATLNRSHTNVVNIVYTRSLSCTSVVFPNLFQLWLSDLA